MEKWIKTYPKIFSKQECSGFVEYFNLQEYNNNLTHTDLKDHRHFDEINLNHFPEETRETQLSVYDRFKNVLHKYKEETGLHKHAWPETFKFEEIRIKRYRMGRGNFLDHVDVGSYDSAMRFLVLFVYLNDVEEGGETEFPELDLTVTPKCGTMLLFPSTWTYLHRGNTPISNDKYILGSYLHYV